MARLQRIAPLGIPQHITQRGNNRQACFACDQDMAFFDSLLHVFMSIWLKKVAKRPIVSLGIKFNGIASALPLIIMSITI